MSHLLPLLFILMSIAIAVAIATAVKKKGAENVDDEKTEKKPDYEGYERKKYLFTPAEFAFYKVLNQAVGSQYSIQVKVRIADLIDVRRPCSSYLGKLNAITRKHIDFILCDPKTMCPLLAIELDDRSHEAADRQKRDVFVNGLLVAVAMPFLRVPVARAYDEATIQALVLKALEAKAA